MSSYRGYKRRFTPYRRRFKRKKVATRKVTSNRPRDDGKTRYQMLKYYPTLPRKFKIAMTQSFIKTFDGGSFSFAHDVMALNSTGDLWQAMGGGQAPLWDHLVKIYSKNIVTGASTEIQCIGNNTQGLITCFYADRTAAVVGTFEDVLSLNQAKSTTMLPIQSQPPKKIMHNVDFAKYDGKSLDWETNSSVGVADPTSLFFGHIFIQTLALQMGVDVFHIKVTQNVIWYDPITPVDA